jgi:glycerophosphoryl diester phosphodiesterase
MVLLNTIYPAVHLYQELYDPNGRVMVVAHRVDWLNVPENSIPAIQNCIEKGIDIVEIDVRKTKDGQLILMHDKTVNRTTDGNGVITEMTFADIRKLHLRDCQGKTTEL